MAITIYETYKKDNRTVEKSIYEKNGKKYNVTLTYNEPSDKALRAFVKELKKL